MRKIWFAIALLSGGFLVAQDYSNTSAAFGRLPRGARLFQHQRARIEGFQRTGDGNRLRWPIQWRLRAYKAEPGHDLRASGYPQDKASQLPRTARRGNGERIAHNELQFRCPE